MPTSPPLVSVITVVRNDARGLAATAASVRAQSLKTLQWVVIDGDSSDETKALALSYRVGGATVISEPDAGIYDAMNKGLSLAAGEFVILLNAGDLFAAPDALEKAAATLRARLLDVLYCGSIMDFGVTRIVRPARGLRYIWHGQPGLHQGTLFRREAHLRFPYDGSFRICGDYDAITRMWAAGLKFGRSDILLSVNEFDAGSASSRHMMQLLREARTIQARNLGLNPFAIAASTAYRLASSGLSAALTRIRAVFPAG